MEASARSGSLRSLGDKEAIFKWSLRDKEAGGLWEQGGVSGRQGSRRSLGDKEAGGF
jgi:hypothetical protein